MKLTIVTAALVGALVLALAQPAFAGDKGAPPSKPKAHTQKHAQRVYGTPIQPPIVKKVRGKRHHAQKVGAPETAAQKKAHAAAVRKRKANEEYRRQHPASADEPR